MSASRFFQDNLYETREPSVRTAPFFYAQDAAHGRNGHLPAHSAYARLTAGCGCVGTDIRTLRRHTPPTPA